MNRALWDERTVTEVLVAVRADQKDERLKKKLELANEQEENEEGDVELWVPQNPKTPRLSLDIL